MKNILVIAAMILSTGAWAATNGSPVQVNSLEFTAPIVNDSANFTNQLPFGSIVYDANSDQFKGLNRSGNWDAMSTFNTNLNVSSSSTEQEHIERVTFAGNSSGSTPCTSSPCTIVSQSGSWISSVTRSATGTYTLNFAAGIFSSTPTCTCTVTGLNSSGNICGGAASQPTTSSWTIGIHLNSGAASDEGVMIVCMGPK